MSNELEILIDEIQFKTKLTIEEIAAKVGYSRPYLNKAKKKAGNKKLIGIIREKFQDVLLRNGNDENGHLPGLAGKVSSNQKGPASPPGQDEGVRSPNDPEYIEFLKSNDAFFKNQYAAFNAQVLANLTALANQQKQLEALIKINLEHTGNIEAMQAGVPQQQIHDDINRDILHAAGVEIDNAVGSPGKG